MTPSIPGYAATTTVPAPQGLLAWRGVRTATGERVRLLLVPCADESAARDRLRAQAASLVALHHPHLLAARDAVSTPQGVVLVHGEPSGQSLTEHLRGRGRLSPGELLTLGLPLADALAAAHDAGIAHGWLGADWVVVDPAGRPVLAGVGIRQLLGPAPDPAADVRALVALLRSAGADPLPSDSLDQLRAALRRGGPPRPLRRDAGAAMRPATTPVVRPRAMRKRVMPVAASLALGCLAVVAGARWGGSEGSASVLPPPPSARPWLEVLRELDAVRDTALAAGDSEALEQVYAAGSPALATEQARVRRLLADGLVARGLALTVQTAEPVDVQGDQVALDVTDAMAAYDVLDAHGRVVAHHEPRPARTWRVSLRQQAGEWRIWSIEAAAP